MRRLKTRTLRFIEFILVGVIMGMIEDMIAVWFSTGQPITPRVVGVVFVVAFIFAIISEYIVDHPRFWEIVLRMKGEPPVDKKN